jgi:hypothetical protein
MLRIVRGPDVPRPRSQVAFLTPPDSALKPKDNDCHSGNARGEISRSAIGSLFHS